jgi:hypothetical protein
VDFNSHSAIAGKHALLSPSSYHWINYSIEKLEARVASATAAEYGTQLHDLAHKAIVLGIKLHTSNKTMSKYVNDAIGYKMTPEQPLYYSDNCFGTADTIGFSTTHKSRPMLRIHDLKTGVTPASVHQLEVYAAIFCLEYGISPYDIDMEFRIYQNDEVQVWIGDPNTIAEIMDTIVEFDTRINFIRQRGV